MYIDSIKICNFRNFINEEIKFNDGLNIIIGHNNAGKTNLLKALGLVINTDQSKKLEISDFNQLMDLQILLKSPPKVSIQVKIKKSVHSNDDQFDELVAISSWLTKLEDDYEAQLTYEYFLPEKEHLKYVEMMSQVKEETNQIVLKNKIWRIIEHNFLRLYIYKIWGGDTKNQEVADRDSLGKIDVQFLDAIRDIERDLFTGKNTLLRDVLEFFMDHDIKSNSNLDAEARNSQIKIRRDTFSEDAEVLIKKLAERMETGKKEILSYATKTGASFNDALPNFDSSPSDLEMLSTLRLIIEYKTGIKIPATHNGLGYNNLIYISLLLSKMQLNTSQNYLGSNAKIFSTLIIEEPEAHLHPSMQYKFLKFLKENHKSKKVRQIFITSHSSSITSAVDLDEIICMSSLDGKTKSSNLKDIFHDQPKSRAYVQRFLDATKSDMLFAQKIILVEGIAEQLLMSIFAQYIDLDLEDQHIAVINIGGRYFDHFLKLFNISNPAAINKKVICITDIDPTRKSKTLKNAKSQICYPYEYNFDNNEYEYSYNFINLDDYKDSPNIKFFQPDQILGKTLEYELMKCNPQLKLLLTPSISNSKELENLIDLYCTGKPINDFFCELLDSKQNDRIKESIKAIPENDPTWTDDELKKAIIASRYLNSVKKGENALELAEKLMKNINLKSSDDYENIIIPTYIKDALEWVCHK